MSTMALQIRHCHVIPASDSYTVILVVNCTSFDNDIARCANVKTVRVVRRWQPVAAAVGSITLRVIQDQALENEIGAARNGKEMNRPVPDIQILNHRVSGHFLDDDEVIWFRDSPV